MTIVAGLGINDTHDQVHIENIGNGEQWICPEYQAWRSLLKYASNNGIMRVDNGLKHLSSFKEMLKQSKYDPEVHCIADSKLLGVGNRLSDYLVLRAEHRGIMRFRTKDASLPAWVSSYDKNGVTHWLVRYRKPETGNRTAKRGFKTKHEASFFAMEMYAARIIGISNTYIDDKRTQEGLITVALQMVTLAKNGIMFFPYIKED